MKNVTGREEREYGSIRTRVKAFCVAEHSHRLQAVSTSCLIRAVCRLGRR